MWVGMGYISFISQKSQVSTLNPSQGMGGGGGGIKWILLNNPKTINALGLSQTFP